LKRVDVVRWIAAFPAAFLAWFLVMLVYGLTLVDGGDPSNLKAAGVTVVLSTLCGISAGVITAPWRHWRVAFSIFAVIAAIFPAYSLVVDGPSTGSATEAATTIGGIIPAYVVTWALRRLNRS
jgi:hypothetical protein